MKISTLGLQLLSMIAPSLTGAEPTGDTPPAAANSHYCLTVDYAEWLRENPDPAGKGLAGLSVEEPFTVRMIYFLPNDRPYDEEVVQRMKTEILGVQSLYAEQMEAHGYGPRTFRIETDDRGDPLVHRLDGRHPDSRYLENTFLTVVEEMGQTFDGRAQIVHFIVMDISANRIEGREGAAWSRRGGGEAMVPSDFRPHAAAHELGHAFGLWHDFHERAYIMSYYPLAEQLSACNAEFLSVSPYFSPHSSSDADHGDEVQESTIERLSSSEYPQAAQTVSVRLQLADEEGLHQALLLTTSEYYQDEVIACRGLEGQREAVVEFDYDGVVPSSGFATLFNPKVHPIRIQVVDSAGNVSSLSFDLVQVPPYHMATLEGHSRWLNAVTFSPDGAMLASGGGDNTIRLWDVEEARHARALEGHMHVVVSLSFSADGRLLASATPEEVRVWDVETGSGMAVLQGAIAVSFSPEDGLLASGARDNTIRFWDVETGQSVAALPGHDTRVSSLAFSPAGAILASGAADGTLKLWDVVREEETATLRGPGGGVNSISFSADGKILAAAGLGGTVRLWDVEGRRDITSKGSRRPDWAISVSLSPDGSTLASGARDGAVQLRDVETGEMAGVLESHGSAVRSVAFSPGGSVLASGGIDGTIKLLDVSEWAGPRARTLRKVSGDEQQGMPGEVVPEPLVIEVRDQYGTPLEGARVSFTVTQGGGKLNGRANAEVEVTDASGRTRTILTLGDRPGRNTVEVSVSGMEETFEAVGVGAPALPTLEGDHRRWNLPLGATLRLGTGGVSQDDRAVYFLPGGQRLSVANNLGIWIHEVGTFRPLALLPIDGEGLNWRDYIAYSADMGVFARARGYEIEVWDLALDDDVATSFGGHEYGISSVALSPQGTALASGGARGTVILRDLESGVPTRTLGHRGTITAMAFSPDGSILASAGSDVVKLWDAATGANLAILEGHRRTITTLAFSPDGTGLASGAGDHTAKLWDVAGGINRATLIGHRSSVASVAFSPDGSVLASGEHGVDSAIRLWDVTTGTSIGVLEGHWYPVTSVAFSPDGNTLASGSWLDGEVKVWDLGNGSSTTLPGHTDEIGSVAFSPDGSTLASAAWPEGTVKLWDVATGTCTAILRGHWYPMSAVRPSIYGLIAVAFSPDGTMVATGAQDHTVKLWEADTGNNVGTLYGHSDRVYWVAFSPDGTMLASGSGDNTVRLWDLATGTSSLTLHGHSDEVISVAFSPDGTMLASGAKDNSVRLWEVASGSVASTFPGHTHWVWSVAFSPDGRLLASGSVDGTVKLWDLDSRKIARTLSGHTAIVRRVVFTSDGTTVVSASDDTTVRLWDVNTGGESVRLRGGEAAVYSVALSPDGRSMASGSSDGTVLLWDLELVQRRGWRLTKLSGENQQLAAGATLAEPFVVSVRDQNGEPLAGAGVTFAVSAGDGTLSTTTDTTDAEGLATTTLTLGIVPGINTVTATVAGLEPVTFAATAEATPDFDGDGETGFSDFFLFAEAFGGTDPRFDLDGNGSVDFADFFLFAEHFGEPARSKLLALARELGLPDRPQLMPNTPNPFNSGTVISWFLLQPGRVRVEVFALTGQRVAVLHRGREKAGVHRLYWDGRDNQSRPLASGVYLYRLVTDGGVVTRKLTLLK